LCIIWHRLAARRRGHAFSLVRIVPVQESGRLRLRGGSGSACGPRSRRPIELVPTGTFRCHRRAPASSTPVESAWPHLNASWPTWPSATSPSSPPWSRPGCAACSISPGLSRASSPEPGSASRPSVTPGRVTGAGGVGLALRKTMTEGWVAGPGPVGS
jgi:hypothetical protein